MNLASKPLAAELDEKTGILRIVSCNLELASTLLRDRFLVLDKLLHRPDNPETAETFFLNKPIEFWQKQFMLSIAFLKPTAPFCSGYGLTPIFDLERAPYDVTHDAEDFKVLSEILSENLKSYSRKIIGIESEIFEYSWGVISLGATIQDSSPFQVSVGWHLTNEGLQTGK